MYTYMLYNTNALSQYQKNKIDRHFATCYSCKQLYENYSLFLEKVDKAIDSLLPHVSEEHIKQKLDLLLKALSIKK